MKQKNTKNESAPLSKRLIRGKTFLRKLSRGKKGISSIFIAIYLALIVILLITALFVGQVISRSSLTDYLKIEQERRQENIQITKIVTDESATNVLYVQVNNTGAITVRIRALYVGEEFKLDPSTLVGDSYIEPKEAMNITLIPPIRFDGDVLSVQWTVTTERGTRSSELGMNLWEETSNPVYTPNKFYFGPLMLLFDMFHWRSGTGPWKSGWSIPKAATDVTWRILLTDADSRPITITDTSCFTLVGNQIQTNKIVPWFVNPELGSLTFLPGRYYFVYYTWDRPYSDSGPQTQGPDGLNVGMPCINFLTFTGHFMELNGTTTAFGQTIPFEAVLITDETMVESVQVSASLQNIRNDGSATSTITAIVTDGKGNPMANRWVDLYSTTGTLSASRLQTSATGSVIVTLTSSSRKELATVYATCEGVSGTCQVAFTPATKTTMTADPATIPKTGNSTITVKLFDQNDAAVAQQGITVTVSQTWSGNKPNTPILHYQTQSSTTAVIVTTDSKGEATIILSGQKSAGSSTLTASSSGLSDGSVVVVLT
jgi:hypothetical protein